MGGPSGGVFLQMVERELVVPGKKIGAKRMKSYSEKGKFRKNSVLPVTRRGMRGAPGHGGDC